MLKNCKKILFNTTYYVGRRGKQNLRRVHVNFFEVATDPQGRRYIHQVVKEFDNNHRESDLKPNNSFRIFKVPGNFNFS